MQAAAPREWLVCALAHWSMFLTCNLQTVFALEDLNAKGQPSTGRSAASAVSAQSSAISLTASANSSVGDDFDYFADAYDADHIGDVAGAGEGPSAKQYRTGAGVRASSGAAATPGSQGNSKADATIGSLGMSYRSAPPHKEAGAMQYSDEELAMYVDSMLCMWLWLAHHACPCLRASQF